MTLEFALAGLGIALVPALGWAIRLNNQQAKMIDEVEKANKAIAALTAMHRQDQKTGFGSAQVEKLLERNTTVLHELTTAINTQLTWFKATHAANAAAAAARGGS